VSGINDGWLLFEDVVDRVVGLIDLNP
jgi:hypothetical protein